MSPEEFFMYLTIALIVLTPIAARLYRLVTMKRTTERLREQLGRIPGGAQPPDRHS